jgi:hypothetical protein
LDASKVAWKVAGSFAIAFYLRRALYDASQSFHSACFLSYSGRGGKEEAATCIKNAEEPIVRANVLEPFSGPAVVSMHVTAEDQANEQQCWTERVTADRVVSL